eukprot:TRINITY_DN56264_c0_g1_i1.p1 TRINITY_DN56264_c0_g1~~TRINITY_DN56264_c0_g1_i1.p1  ORF type:complete len:974 (+),score=241.24 TRINITY_DN56264_c0_g1_i1:299-3220(+)
METGMRGSEVEEKSDFVWESNPFFSFSSPPTPSQSRRMTKKRGKLLIGDKVYDKIRRSLSQMPNIPRFSLYPLPSMHDLLHGRSTSIGFPEGCTGSAQLFTFILKGLKMKNVVETIANSKLFKNSVIRRDICFCFSYRRIDTEFRVLVAKIWKEDDSLELEKELRLTAEHLLGGVDVEGIGWKDFVWAVQSVVNGLRQDWGCQETTWSESLVYKMRETLNATHRKEQENDVHFPLLQNMTDCSFESWSFRDPSVVDAFLEVVPWMGFRLLPDDQHQDLIFGIFVFEEIAKYPHEVVYLSRKVFVCLQWKRPTDPSQCHKEFVDPSTKPILLPQDEVDSTLAPSSIATTVARPTTTTTSTYLDASPVGSGKELSALEDEMKKTTTKTKTMTKVAAFSEEEAKEPQEKLIQHVKHSRSVSFNPSMESVEPHPEETQRLLEGVLDTFRKILISCSPGIWRDGRMSTLKAKESDLKMLSEQYLSLRTEESSLVWNCRSLIDKSYERIKPMSFPSPISRIRWDQISEQRESFVTFVGKDLDAHSHEFAFILSYLRSHPALVLSFFQSQLEQESAYEEDHFIDFVMEELFDEFSCSPMSIISFLHTVIEECDVDDIILASQKRISTRSSLLVRVLIRMMEREDCQSFLRRMRTNGSVKIVDLEITADSIHSFHFVVSTLCSFMSQPEFFDSLPTILRHCAHALGLFVEKARPGKGILCIQMFLFTYLFTSSGNHVLCDDALDGRSFGDAVRKFVISWTKGDSNLEDDSDFAACELRMMHERQLNSLAFRILHDVHFETKDRYLKSKGSTFLPWMTVSSLHLHLLHYMLHLHGSSSFVDMEPSSKIRLSLDAILTVPPRAILHDEDSVQIIHDPTIFDHIGHGAIWDGKLLNNVQNRLKMIDWNALASCDEDALTDLQSVTSLLVSTSKQFSIVGDYHAEIIGISETMYASIQALKNRCEKLRSTFISLSIGKCRKQKNQ